jgi:hypothetical protein
LFPSRSYEYAFLSGSQNAALLDSPVSDNPMAVIKAIRARNMKVGVAISPDTPSTAITDEVAEAADMLLVMTVYPGPQPIFAISYLDYRLFRSRRAKVLGQMRPQGS